MKLWLHLLNITPPMLRKSISLLFLFFGLSSFFFEHDYYLSTTTLNWAAEKGELQLTSRFFIDDLEAFMQQEGHPKVVFQPDSDSQKIDDFVAQFYQNQIQISVDNELQTIRYLGREYQDDLLVIYAEIKLAKKEINRLEVENTFLTEFLPSQQNLVHLRGEKLKKSFLLNAKRTHFSYSFKE